jgi:hypothetical protein
MKLDGGGTGSVRSADDTEVVPPFGCGYRRVQLSRRIVSDCDDLVLVFVSDRFDHDYFSERED